MIRIQRAWLLILPAALGAVLLGLAADSTPAGAATDACPSSNPPNELQLAGGSGQTAQLGKPFPAGLQVQLANSNGCPLSGNLAGVNVHFDAPGSGASGVFAGSGSREAVVGTDSKGIATAPTFTANFTSGSYTVDAHSDYGTVQLYLSNTADGLASAIAPVGTAGQEATVNSWYGRPLQARVTDASGNPVQGATVAFAIAAGPTGASAGFLAGGQATAITNSDGIATSPPLLANTSAGRFTAAASTVGVAGVATYSLDNHAAATSLAAWGSTTLSATIASRYPKPLAARLLDANGQPIEGASVTFSLASTATSGGGGGGTTAAGASFLGGGNQASVLTDATGVATTPPIVANTTAGDLTATAIAAGINSPLTYTLHNLAVTLTAGGPTRSATVEHRYTRALTVRVRGSGGKPVEGISVTFVVATSSSGAGASFPDGASQATATSNRAGIATAPTMTANSIAGSFKATATVTGSKPFSYTLQNRAGKPQVITAGAADGTSTTVGSRLPVRLAVTVTDANGNPVAGAIVTFAAPAHGPTGRFTTHAKKVRVAHVRTHGNGVAVAPPFTANTVTGGYIVSTTSEGGAHAAFALTNTRR